MNYQISRLPRRQVAAIIAIAILASAINLKPTAIQAALATATSMSEAAQSNGLEFESNRGQFPADVRYFARSAGANVFLTATEAVYVMKPKSCGSEKDVACDNVRDDSNLAFALRMKLVGANPSSLHSGEAQSEHRTNYLKGPESDWVTDVPNYGRVRFDEVYDGVSMIWHGLENRTARYDFAVAPGADPSQISLQFAGSDSVEIDADGNLRIETAAGTLIHQRPISFQEIDGVRVDVESSFKIESDGRVGFALGQFDRTQTLTIDPTVNLANIAFSTFLGGFNNDTADDLAVDSIGSVYVTGTTESPFFPTTAGTFDTTHNANGDVFIARMNPAGTQLIYSTFVGGSGVDGGRGIAVDQVGNAYVTGVTGSTAFPTTAGAFDTTFNLGSDVYVLKLNPTGSSLVFSTFVGGSGSEESFDIARDSSNNVYVIGRSTGGSPAFPTTAGGFDTTFGGVNDAVFFKLDSLGATLSYSTFFGGSAFEFGQSVAVDSAGNAYLTGYTSSTDFPTTAGVFDSTFGGNNDAFVSKINPSASGASSLVYSTYLGGTDEDAGQAIAIDTAGNAYIVGDVINGGGFPTTTGAYDTTHNGAVDVFVVKINTTGSALVYSTFIGSSVTENGNAIAVDASGNATITGLTGDGVIDFPTTAGAFDTTQNGGQDVFVTKFNASGTGLIYSTYLGGTANDVGKNVAQDLFGNIYICGTTADSATLLPTTAESIQPLHGGLDDAFVTKFGDYSISGRVIDASSGAPLSSVMIALSGQTSDFMLTGTDGRFGFTNTVSFQPFAVSASRAGYSINPSVFNIGSLNNNRDLVFVGTVGSPTGGSGGTLRFDNVSYGKSEDGGSVTVNVKRIGEVQTTDPVTVDFTTVGGTASDGTDFTGVSGTLTFNALEMSKSVTIPIVNDGLLEPKETFSIAISNPTNNADIETNRGSTTIQIVDEDLGAGDLVISEFRQRGRLGARDEYVKLFNPNDFDVTIQTADGSAGLTLVQDSGSGAVPVAVIPNLVTIGARGHFLLTNNDPNGGFSLIDYPTGRGTATAVGDLTFTTDLADNAALALVKSNAAGSLTPANSLDTVAFGESAWSEGKGLAPINGLNSEMSFVRRLLPGGVRDTGNNLADFLMVDNHASVFEGLGQVKVLTTLGAPAPETTESLRAIAPDALSITEFGSESYDPTPIENGRQGTLTVYRTLTNNSNAPLTALRLRAIEFPTLGSELSRRYSSRPDFRLASAPAEGNLIGGTWLAATHLQPNGGGINSTLEIDSVSALDPLLPGESITVAIRFTVMRYGRHPIMFAAEGNE